MSYQHIFDLDTVDKNFIDPLGKSPWEIVVQFQLQCCDKREERQKTTCTTEFELKKKKSNTSVSMVQQQSKA